MLGSITLMMNSSGVSRGFLFAVWSIFFTFIMPDLWMC